jgi:flavodoxin
MRKKIIAIILVVVGLLAIAVGVFLVFNKDSDTKKEDAMKQQGESIMNKDDKAIVVYFSAQNHTRNVATKIAANVGADIFEIEPVQAYTEDDLSWTDSESRVSREHNDESLQAIELKSTTVPNWDEYDTVFIGYPIWWGGSSWVVDSFVKKVDFGDKTVIPFCTSHSSGLGTSDTDLKAKATGGNWQPGHRFSQDATDAEIKTWTDSLL